MKRLTVVRQALAKKATVTRRVRSNTTWVDGADDGPISRVESVSRAVRRLKLECRGREAEILVAGPFWSDVEFTDVVVVLDQAAPDWCEEVLQEIGLDFFEHADWWR